MSRALAQDLLQLPDTEVIMLRDARLEACPIPRVAASTISSAGQERELLESWGSRADWTLLIAPEIGNALVDRCRWVEAAGGRLLGPDSRLVALASDKQATAEHLADAGLPVPRGVRLLPGERPPPDLPYPAVLKPCDGAGSHGVRWIADVSDRAIFERGREVMRLEQWHPGMAASVALLCGPREVVVLEPCGQRLSEDGQFRYLGGFLPLPGSLADRARDLGRKAARALSPSSGFLGIDLVLGNDGAASDVIIEVNPRMTTSYLGLRRAAHGNLGAAMMALAAGQRCDLSFGTQRVEFAPDEYRARETACHAP